ncbi:hypothetical protein [Streptomyces sp. NPDC096311]|uniref:hypothetical protein n=1 Tax=Streptomyces sp. NPDC096311 TaxID=3366083 RepID=UPI00382B0062
MPSTDRFVRRCAPAAVAPTLGAGLPAAPAVPAQAADTPRLAAHYTFDQDDLASGRISDSSRSGLTAGPVNGTTAQSVAARTEARRSPCPAARPPPTARTSSCPAKCSATQPTRRSPPG